jgi:hypothetical protein
MCFSFLGFSIDLEFYLVLLQHPPTFVLRCLSSSEKPFTLLTVISFAIAGLYLE